MVNKIKPAPRWARFGYGLSIAGTLISRFATLAILILLPAKIGHTDYGLFALVITAGEMIEMTTSNWYRLILLRQATGGDSTVGTKGLTFKAIIILAAVLAFALSIAAAPFAAQDSTLLPALAIAVYAFAFIWFRLIVTLLQATGRQSLIGAVEFLRGIFTFALAMGVVYAGHVSFVYPAIAVAIATFLSGLALYPVLHHDWRRILHLIVTRDAFFALGVPLVIATILTYQFGWIDRFVIQSWLGPQMVGLYVAAMAIARQPIDIFLNTLNSQTFPVLLARIQAQLRNEGSGAQEQMAAVLVALSIMGFGAAAGLIALAPLLNGVFLPTFEQHLTNALTPWLAIGAVCLGLKHFVFDNVFHAAGRNWSMLGWFAACSAAAFILALVLVPRMGVEGAAISFCIGAATSLLASALQTRRIFSFALPWARLLAVAFSAAIAAAAAWLTMTYLPAANWVRLIVCGSAFGAVYLALLCISIDFRLKQFLSAPWEAPQLKRA